MGTPAAQVFSSAGAPPAGAPPAAGTPPSATPGAGAPPASNQPFFSGWFDGNQPEGKEISGWLANKNFADPATLVKSYRGLETEAATLRSAANLKGYPTPTKNADGTVKPVDPAALSAWKTAMGVPESADKYDFGDLAKTPGVDPGFVKLLAEELHGVHTPAALATVQAGAYERAVARHVENLIKAENEQSEAAKRQVESEWGANFQERSQLGKRGMDFIAKQVGGLTDEQWRQIERTVGTGKFMNMMWQFGSGNREMSFPSGNSNGDQGFVGGVAAAQAEYDQLMADRTNGKISDRAWRETGSKREQELAAIIAGGFAPTT